MTINEFEKLEQMFQTSLVNLPSLLKSRLSKIPITETRTNFWDWSWGLPIIFLFPTIFWLFVKNVTAIGEFILTMIKSFSNLLTLSIPINFLLVSIWIGTLFVCIVIFVFFTIENRSDYRFVRDRF